MVVSALSTTGPLNVCARILALPSWPVLSSLLFSKPMQKPWNEFRRFRSTGSCRNVQYCRQVMPGYEPMQLLRSCGHCHGSICSDSRWVPVVHCASAADQSSSQQAIEGAAVVEFRYGNPVLKLTLPSSDQRCEFTLRPFTDTVSEICEHVQREDGGAGNVGIYSTEGTKIAGSTLVEHLMQADFHIRINDRTYAVRPPKRPAFTMEHFQQLDGMKALVANMHAALNTEETYLRNERELVEKVGNIQQTLEPLEKQKQLLEAASDRRTNRLLWTGLALMGIQLGAFLRLTWFEYSWDIMEPVTYFTTYTAVIAGYAYFVATRIHYEYPDAKERMALNRFYKLCRRSGFDVDQYNRMKDDLHELQKDLDRLRRSPNSPSRGGAPSERQTITVKRSSKPTTEGPGNTSEQNTVDVQVTIGAPVKSQ